MTAAELDHRMSPAEFVEWKVFYGRKRQREEIQMAKAKRGRKR